MRELAADGVPVAVTCRVLKLARQPYYRWLAEPVGAREVARAHLANAIFEYLEIFHNRQRQYSARGWLPPLEFESRQPITVD